MARNIIDQPRKRAMLLHYAGEAVVDIFETLSSPGDANTYDEALEKLAGYFAPKRYAEFDTFKFRQTRQDNTETLDQYATRLRQLAVHCDFSDPSREMKIQIIQGCCSMHLRRKALRDPTMSLRVQLRNADQQLNSLKEKSLEITELERQLASVESKHTRLETEHCNQGMEMDAVIETNLHLQSDLDTIREELASNSNQPEHYENLLQKERHKCKKLEQELLEVLLNYHDTPHSSNNVAPATLLLGKTTKGKLSHIEDAVDVQATCDQALAKDALAKEKVKSYADAQRHAQQPTIQIADTALVKPPNSNKLSTRFETEPRRVTHLRGSMVRAARSDGHTLTRNSSLCQETRRRCCESRPATPRAPVPARWYWPSHQTKAATKIAIEAESL